MLDVLFVGVVVAESTHVSFEGGKTKVFHGGLPRGEEEKPHDELERGKFRC